MSTSPASALPFSNLHIAITGGTGALGTAVVSRFLEAGATCHIPCLHDSELKHFPQYLATHDRVKLTPGVDLTDEPAVETFYASIPTPLWASIHIAGGFAYAPIHTMPKADFVRLMQINILTCFLCSREAVKRMDAGKSGGSGGRIVNVSARAALEPRTGANMTAYTAAKSAVAGFTQALAEEVIGRNILVNAVLPSIMDTPQNRKDMPTADFSKWAKVEDVAATIAFLASPQNTCTRGGLVPVYGGT